MSLKVQRSLHTKDCVLTFYSMASLFHQDCLQDFITTSAEYWATGRFLIVFRCIYYYFMTLCSKQSCLAFSFWAHVNILYCNSFFPFCLILNKVKQKTMEIFSLTVGK